MPLENSYMAPGLVVGCAKRWLGTPYVHQASCRGAGTDCLGLIRGIYRELYGHEPEPTPAYTADWAEASGSETLHDAAARHLIPIDLTDVQPGDALLFRMVASGPAKHAGICADNDRMIHAYADRAVCETQLGRWWHDRLAFAFRWPPAPTPQVHSQ